MKVLATSDWHGNLPDVPPCDLLLIGGDICPDFEIKAPHDQYTWLGTYFASHLERLRADGVKQVVAIAGNHDFIFENREAIDRLDLPWTYLQDEETVVDGLRIWGIPWVPNLPFWAFHASKDELQEYYKKIPKGIDIVLSHGPPYGYGDRILGMHFHRGQVDPHVGARPAIEMMQRVKPQAFICGHIHEGFGSYSYWRDDKGVDIYNVAYVDEYYTPREHIVEVMVDAQQEQEESPDTEREVHSSSASAG